MTTSKPASLEIVSFRSLASAAVLPRRLPVSTEQVPYAATLEKARVAARIEASTFSFRSLAN